MKLGEAILLGSLAVACQGCELSSNADDRQCSLSGDAGVVKEAAKRLDGLSSNFEKEAAAALVSAQLVVMPSDTVVEYGPADEDSYGGHAGLMVAPFSAEKTPVVVDVVAAEAVQCYRTEGRTKCAIATGVELGGLPVELRADAVREVSAFESVGTEGADHESGEAVDTGDMYRSVDAHLVTDGDHCQSFSAAELWNTGCEPEAGCPGVTSRMRERLRGLWTALKEF